MPRQNGVMSDDDVADRVHAETREAGRGWRAANPGSGMAPAGQVCVDAARRDGSWTRLDDVEDLVVPADLAEAFGRHPGARGQWEAFPRSARRGVLEWVMQ